MAKLDTQLAALVTMSPAQLREEWERVLGSAPPLLSSEQLQRGIAYALQEKKHGGLPAWVKRELDRAASGEAPVRTPAPELRAGTQLIREWQGRTISVMVEEGGAFLFEGTRYGSLSSIAKHVTGAHWSGPRFFGIKAHA
jgi:hypothetical protein